MLINDVWAALANTHAIVPSPTLTQRADIVLEGPSFPPTAYDIKIADVLYPSRVGRYADRYLVYPAAQRLVITAAATPAALTPPGRPAFPCSSRPRADP